MGHDEMEEAAFLFACRAAAPSARRATSAPALFFCDRSWERKTILGNLPPSLLLFLFDELPGRQFQHSLSIVSNDKNLFSKSESCQVDIVVCSLQYRYSLIYGGFAY